MEFHLENPIPFSSVSSLFHLESDHMPSPTYSSSLRRETISLILHLSPNSSHPFLPYLAINYLDRFLSTHPLQEGKPWILRLLAVSCLSLAFKMTKTESSVTPILQDCGGLIFDMRTIERMEFLILGALQWRLRSVTPFSFINFFASSFKFKDQPSLLALKARASEIILKAQLDTRMIEFKPSLIASSALLSSCHELFPLQFLCFRKAILSHSHVNKDNLFRCYNVMEEIAMEGYESVLDMAVSSSNTPVNVLDRQCSSSSSDSEKTNPAAIDASATTTAIIRLDRDSKRRKISSSTFRNDNTFQISQIQRC